MDRFITKNKKVIKPHPKKTLKEANTLSNEYLETIQTTAYIGKKGYTISKSALTNEDIEFLRKDLFVKPQIMGATYGSPDATAFPVYRENANKIYLPRFYGIQRYGIPMKTDIEPGDNIQLEFAKTLRDYQTKIIDVYTKYVDRKLCAAENSINWSGGILEVPCGRGKTVMALKIISTGILYRAKVWHGCALYPSKV